MNLPDDHATTAITTTLALSWRDGREETVEAGGRGTVRGGEEETAAEDGPTTTAGEDGTTSADEDGPTSAAEESETVLVAAEAAGVAIPFGCRTGACGTCAGRLVAGEVSHERPPRALKAGHLRDGYVLCCIARPETDCRIEVGAAVRDALLTNPFQ